MNKTFCDICGKETKLKTVRFDYQLEKEDKDGNYSKYFYADLCTEHKKEYKKLLNELIIFIKRKN